MDREDVTIPSGGTTLAAWLYRPDGEGRHPAVVLAHGFGAPKAARLGLYAERFVQVPFADGLRTAMRLLSLSSLKVTFAALLDLVRSAFGGDPVRIPLVGPPGSTHRGPRVSLGS